MALTREILLFAVLLSIYPDPYIHPIRGVGEMHANMKVKFYYKILLLKFWHSLLIVGIFVVGFMG